MAKINQRVRQKSSKTHVIFGKIRAFGTGRRRHSFHRRLSKMTKRKPTFQMPLTARSLIQIN